MLKLQAKGERVPALETKPEPLADLWPVWQMYNDLHGARPSGGFGPCPLAVSDILAMFDLRQVYDSESRQDMFDQIAAMDGEWMKWARSKTKSNDTSATPTNH